MWNILAATLGALLLVCTDYQAVAADAPKRAMPHHDECEVPLPTDFWDNDKDAESFKMAEEWAWNDRICLGKPADMRQMPDGHRGIDICSPTEIEKNGHAVPPPSAVAA